MEHENPRNGMGQDLFMGQEAQGGGRSKMVRFINSTRQDELRRFLAFLYSYLI